MSENAASEHRHKHNDKRVFEDARNPGIELEVLPALESILLCVRKPVEGSTVGGVRIEFHLKPDDMGDLAAALFACSPIALELKQVAELTYTKKDTPLIITEEAIQALLQLKRDCNLVNDKGVPCALGEDHAGGCFFINPKAAGERYESGRQQTTEPEAILETPQRRQADSL